MKCIDLTHVIHPQMPVYPGTEPPIFEAGTTLEKDGFLEKKISFFSHTGTHMDAPAHIIPAGKTLDALHVNTFYGEALCLHVKEKKITKAFLQEHEKALHEVDFLLLSSGWDQYWGEKAYFKDFPTLDVEAANYLCTCKLKGIGLDMISIDPVEDERLPIHHIILGHDMLIIENLKNLRELPKRVTLSALPLHVKEADGAPVRAMAIISKDT